VRTGSPILHETENQRPRIFSEERKNKIHFDSLLSQTEVKEWKEIHFNILNKVTDEISKTRQMRFGGFMSPQKLSSKLLSTLSSETKNLEVAERKKPLPLSMKDIIKEKLETMKPHLRLFSQEEQIENSFMDKKFKRCFSPKHLRF
jgi:hypothetical protein